MTSAAGTGAAGPLIAGASMSTGEFHDFSDDELAASNLFDFSNSPDTLQSLDSIGNSDQKSFLNPQELTSGPFPDSPNGSYQDSSSESASSTKRAGSSASAKTPATAEDIHMDDGGDDIKMDWENHNFGTFDDDDAFTFGREPDSSVIDGIYGFGEQDDAFMDRSFDFESASSSPDAPSAVQTNVASPAMPTIKTQSLEKQDSLSKPKAPSHKKRGSVRVTSQHETFCGATNQRNLILLQQMSMSSSTAGQKREASRELSPMSTMVASHDSSPAAALFSTPSPHNAPDWSSIMNGAAMWPNKLNISSPIATEALPTPTNFGRQHMTHPISLTQQMPLFNPPTYNFTGGYELRILPTPLKSRVETQIPIKMALNPLPPGVTKLHLPPHTISKPKLLARPAPERSPDTLELFVSLVCTSAMDQPEAKQRALERAASVPQRYLPDLDDEENSPQNGGDVRICAGCITRERKRAARKKVKKPDEEKVWSQDEERRVVVFNTQEVKEWQPISGVMDPSGRPEPVGRTRAMQIDAPMRIACYCRHHNEKMGFNVIFTIKDYQDRVIAQAMSNPIMITDDHKTHPMAQLTAPPAMSEAVTSSTVPMLCQPPLMDMSNLIPAVPNGAFSFSQSTPDLSSMPHSTGQSPFNITSSGKTTPVMGSAVPPGRPLSRPPSPCQGGPAKKRKSSASRVPNGLAMTRLDTSPAASSHTAAGAHVTAVTSPFSPNTNPANPFAQPEQLFGQPNGQLPFANGPPTPNSNDQTPFFGNNRSASMDNLTMAHLYSAPTSNHPSRAPSPNGLRNNIGGVPQNQFAQALAGSLYSSLPLGVGQASQTRAPPIIHKIIPNEGPKIGGIEVTVLGASFFQGLEVWFGENKATTTTYWGDSSLVCLLPPSAVAGPVGVTFKHQGMQATQSFGMGKQPPVFKYIDDNEDKLIRTALSVLGHKMSGQMVDVSDLARRILNDGNSGWSNGSSAGQSSGGGGGGAVGGGSVFNRGSSSNEHLESQLLKCLDLIDLDNSSHRTRLDMKRSTGHTMLHLACSLGYHRFVAALLARGANPDVRDNGGFTPLHMASIHNHPEIVRRLMLTGADPTIRSLSSLTAADVAQSRAVLRTIRSSRRHARSRSGGSLHSRTSSATSMRSMWEPLTKAHTHEEPMSVDSSEESLEYTSGDLDDEDPDEDTYLNMRRSSTIRPDMISPDGAPEDPTALETTTPLGGALKDQVQQQIQQFQQSMALHFQNLAHLPQIPQMPQMLQMPTFSGMPMLPDYQAYLPQAQFMRRVQQMMPSMTGSRPTSSGENNPKMDSRWWDLSSYMNTAAVPPPAYDEIFPQEDMDLKQQSAARAAVDAEADLKCSTIYNEVSTSTSSNVAVLAASVSSSTEIKKPIPSILKIGRKNAITKEQQENFLRAREEKLTGLSSDRNLFFVWVCLSLHHAIPHYVSPLLTIIA